ncbi:MAG: histidine--tRNA ligase [Candidatus Pacebacteria bacterium]|nr:histidine--tRNA ligase [Candidatus Paceibacterota bacterium]
MNKQTKDVPKRLAGFRDFFADDIQVRDYVINTFKKVFEKYGYEPLQTPALEPVEIFAGKAGKEAEKLFYRFVDEGGREVMLKYEVMISMCRAVAENINQIPLPYKRYQIQNVWRAEKPQKGRYREFTQCDADTIGSSSVICDAEFIEMGIEAIKSLGFSKFQASISNRKFLNGIIKLAGAEGKDFMPICLTIDKLPKIGPKAVLKELLEKRNINRQVAEKILKIITETGSSKELLEKYQKSLKKIPIGLEGIKELTEIFNYLNQAGIKPDRFQFCPYIARGLAYYTGPIWEFEVLDGNVGSIAGCGRYDQVISNFIGRPIPATGGSFGIERIVELIKDRQMIEISPTKIRVLVTYFQENTFNNSLEIAQSLRQENTRTMLYPEPAKLDKQLKFADRKGIPVAVIIGPDEVKNKTVTIKNLKKRTQKTIPQDDLLKEISAK